ncbi:MAG: hypothetical protein M3Y76_05515, partial [Chloroflexota bacterium]|nr:hypothetical protein [Chloroflexota bacterium]
NKRAIDYRNFNKIPHNLGTAVNVQSMVFGNMGNDSGTGLPSHAILALVRMSLRRKAKSRQTTPWAMTGR